MTTLKGLAAIGFSLVALTGLADEPKAQPSSGIVKVEKAHATVDVNPDGTFTQTNEIVIKVLKEEGIRAASQAQVSYSESLQDVTFVSAQTLKSDGSVVPVPAANIQDRAAIAGGGPMFSDIKAKVVIFPDLEVGDRVSYTVKLVQKTAMFPGQFSFMDGYSDSVEYDDVQDSITVPAHTLELHVFASGMDGGPLEDKDGRQRWTWTYHNDKIVQPEPGQVSPIEYGPRLLVTSFKDFGAIAAAYQERAGPKSVATDQVRKQALELTKGVKDPRARAEILYRWVARNIHYAGNCIGVGSVVPHDVDTIFSNRMGDCKDHTALLQAMLASVGIDSTPALVNSGPIFTLPELPVVQVFNHVITYIPSLDTYVDSTADYVPFGLLPNTENGKPVINTAQFTGITHTPLMDLKSSLSHHQVTLHINADGSADGEAVNQEQGIMATGVRALLAKLEPNAEDRVVRGIISQSGFTGTGQLTKSDPRESPDPYTYGLTFHLDNFIEVPGPGAARLPSVLLGAFPIAGEAISANQPARTHNFACFGGVSTEDYILEFPKQVKVTSVPKDVHLSNDIAKYDATYKLDGSIVTVHREVSDTKSGECTPADDATLKPLSAGILKDLRAQVLYQ